MERLVELLTSLDLTEYEARSLAALQTGGESKASDLAERGGVPRPKVYGALSSLADRGVVEKIPGRPTRYRAKPPEETVRILRSRLERRYERSIATVEEAEEEMRSLGGEAAEREDLLHLVGVGEGSLAETRSLYGEAEERVAVATKAMEYLPDVEDALRDAVDRGVSVRALMLDPSALEEENCEVQRRSVGTLRDAGAEVRYSTTSLPLRGTVIDRNRAALFVVEERGVPFTLRDAAVTRNPSLVAGMRKYFDLIWREETTGPSEG